MNWTALGCMLAGSGGLTLLGQVAATETGAAWPGWLGNLSATAVLAWYAYHNQTKTIPDLVAGFQSEAEKLRTLFTTEAGAMRTTFTNEIKEERANGRRYVADAVRLVRGEPLPAHADEGTDIK